jgi:hypothetical protein
LFHHLHEVFIYLRQPFTPVKLVCVIIGNEISPFEETWFNMAKVKKRRLPKKKPPQRSKHDQIFKRKRSFAEKFLIVMGVLIVLSMILGTIISQAGTGF